MIVLRSEHVDAPTVPATISLALFWNGNFCCFRVELHRTRKLWANGIADSVYAARSAKDLYWWPACSIGKWHRTHHEKESIMTASPSGNPRGVMRTADTSTHYTLSGWAVCAAALLIVVGAFNLMHGIVALENSEYLVNQYLYDNLDFWGWAFIVWGALQMVAGFAAFGSGSMMTFGALTGITLAVVGAVLWFFMIFAAPFAAIVGIALNVVIIYGMSQALNEESV
jgi:hypothetical protein